MLHEELVATKNMFKNRALDHQDALDEEESDVLRNQVSFAVTCQPGEECAAIDGDAYGIMLLGFFARKVAPEWLDGISIEL